VRKQNRVFLTGSVLTALACRCHKLLSRACAGCSCEDAASLGSESDCPEGRPNPVRNTRTGAFCFSCHALSMPDFGAIERHVDRRFVSGYGFSHIETDAERWRLQPLRAAPKGANLWQVDAARLKACPDTNRSRSRHIGSSMLSSLDSFVPAASPLFAKNAKNGALGFSCYVLSMPDFGAIRTRQFPLRSAQ